MNKKELPLIHGVGINDLHGNIKKNKVTKKAYDIWVSMLNRAYNKDFKSTNLAYTDVYVCDEWLYFSNFKKWFDENYRWDLIQYGIKLELDKDMICKDKKVYSPETCVFIPKKVNTFIQDKTNVNTSGYIGVHFHKHRNKYEVRIREFYTGKSKYLGLYDDPEIGYGVYKKEKIHQLECVKEWLMTLGYKEDIIQKIDKNIRNFLNKQGGKL